MLWSAPRSWTGSTVAILAGGPSLRGFDVSALSGVRILTINDSWRIAPRADVHFFTDASFWADQVKRNPKSLDGSAYFTDTIYRGFWVKGGNAAVAGENDFDDHPQVHVLRHTGQLGLETDPSALRHGSNSGYAALNLAYHFGAARILLLGYDMTFIGVRTHWHDGPREAPPVFERTIAQTFLPPFPSIAGPLATAGVEVINCTPSSALKVWPYMPLAEALSREANS